MVVTTRAVAARAAAASDSQANPSSSAPADHASPPTPETQAPATDGRQSLIRHQIDFEAPRTDSQSQSQRRWFHWTTEHGESGPLQYRLRPPGEGHFHHLSALAARDYGSSPTIGFALYPDGSDHETLADRMYRIPGPLRDKIVLLRIVTNDPESLLSATTRARIGRLVRYAQDLTHTVGGLERELAGVIRWGNSLRSSTRWRQDPYRITLLDIEQRRIAAPVSRYSPSVVALLSGWPQVVAVCTQPEVTGADASAATTSRQPKVKREPEEESMVASTGRFGTPQGHGRRYFVHPNQLDRVRSDPHFVASRDNINRLSSAALNAELVSHSQNFCVRTREEDIFSFVSIEPERLKDLRIVPSSDPEACAAALKPDETDYKASTTVIELIPHLKSEPDASVSTSIKQEPFNEW